MSEALIDTISRATGYPNVSQHVRVDGIDYLLPLARRALAPLVAVDFSYPFSVHTEITPAPVDAATLREIVQRAYTSGRHAVILQGVTYEPLLAASGLARVHQTSTHRIDLRDGRYADRFNSHLSRKLNKARKSGVVVTRHTDAVAYRRFYELYALSSQRWGRSTPKYRAGFFEALAGAPLLDARFATLEGRLLSGIILIKRPDCWFYWFGANDTRQGNTGASHLLLAAAIADAAEHGVTTFDLGVSGKLQGVRELKESFGAGEVTFGLYYTGPKLLQHALSWVLTRAG